MSNYSINLAAHLTCFETEDDNFEPPPQLENVIIDNQFGELTLDVGKSTQLCVPARKDIAP